MISRELAICILFCVEQNEKNVIRLSKRINDMGSMEIVYTEDPERPVLIPLRRRQANPTMYHTYIAPVPKESEADGGEMQSDLFKRC
ncbi:hypothetical protein DM01DRAFT_1332700 [Hesseltinella vesiculosa]|uniref:Uncharacterized protein n=1 Tax=Hesseltinella vesiculosa TaxID=101127 RepID=A0A1X2GSW7_9FUNG|nr:hypothetical protein DM01DRAFT_1332700 [Hesseltinella vesiculosa]